jgi:protein-cysteine N-palmitoyltransferase HHAT
VSYTPLYIAGPIITFNNFVSQLNNPINGARKEAIKNIIWTTFLVLLLDVMVHYSCLYAISVSYAWERFAEAWQVGLVGFWSMQFMYMKYLCIWRYFRTVSLVDGIVPPENMPRCMHNNNTFTGFWRSWHASFNQWSLRYLYIPLGGRHTQQYSIWLIFFFIGLWHDLWWSWIAWALLNCVCFSIEIAIMKYWASSRVNQNFIILKFHYLKSLTENIIWYSLMKFVNNGGANHSFELLKHGISYYYYSVIFVSFTALVTCLCLLRWFYLAKGVRLTFLVFL